MFLRRTSVELEISLSSTVGAAMAATARMLEITTFWKATMLKVRLDEWWLSKVVVG